MHTFAPYYSIKVHGGAPYRRTKERKFHAGPELLTTVLNALNHKQIKFLRSDHKNQTGCWKGQNFFPLHKTEKRNLTRYTMNFNNTRNWCNMRFYFTILMCQSIIAIIMSNKYAII